MNIIRLLFYPVGGLMDSSFLTWTTLDVVNGSLGLYAFILFVKVIIQFGLPNHPAKFTLYVVTLCASIFFVAKAAVGFGIISPWFWIKWRPLPLVAGSLALLLQVIMTIGSFSIFQQKVVSRIPLIAGLLVFAFFPTKAEFFFGLCIFVACGFLTISVGKARYQKRLFLKMTLFLVIMMALKLSGNYWMFVVGECFTFVALFYFFLFENSFGVFAVVDRHKESQELVP